MFSVRTADEEWILYQGAREIYFCIWGQGAVSSPGWTLLSQGSSKYGICSSCDYEGGPQEELHANLQRFYRRALSQACTLSIQNDHSLNVLTQCGRGFSQTTLQA